MRLSEVAISKNERDTHWFATYCGSSPYRVSYREGANGRVYHIKGDINIQDSGALENGFPMTIDTVDGNLYVYSDAAFRLKSLKTFPKNVTGALKIDGASITTFEGLPKCESLWADDISESSLTDLLKHVKGPMDCISYDSVAINEFEGIVDNFKFPVKQLWLSAEGGATGGIGFILVPGITNLSMLTPEHVDDHKGWNIIKKYIGRPEDIFECQAELIENGFERLAIL